jgi:hypothetical protein
MMTDDALASFASARVALRDNAKWVLGGAGALLALILGSATVSQFGSLNPRDDGWRFWLAAGSGLSGLILSAIPFNLAVDLLLVRVVSMDDFLKANRGPKRRACEAISQRIDANLSQGSVRAFVQAYNYQVKIKDTAATQVEVDAAQEQINLLSPQYNEISQAMTTQFTSFQFENLMNMLRYPGFVVVILFSVFTWAANPPKDGDKLLAKPVVQNFAADLDTLAAMKGVVKDQACLTPSARVIMYADVRGGARAGVLISPKTGVDCPLVPVDVLNHRIRPAD